MRLISESIVFCALPALGMLARSCTTVTAASMVSWWSSLERDIVKSDDFHNGNFFSPTLAQFTREAEGSGNSLLLNLTESHCIFKLNISPLILSCMFYESSASAFSF